MPQKIERYSAAWPQFLVAKRAMLSAYDQALVHAKQQVVSTHHGLVGEAAVRAWLEGFLPKRYGVTAGHIRSQGLPKPYQTGHFDVIIYDQIEAPTLWIEDNKDKSDSGLVKIIPAEFVRAVLEVKAAFNRTTVRDAIAKLTELGPLTSGNDRKGENYPKFLPASTLLAMLFFELRVADQRDMEALNLIRNIQFQRPFYGAVILRGEGNHPDATALVEKYYSDVPHAELNGPEGLLSGMVMSATTQLHSLNVGATLRWGDIGFSQFAFDLLAILKGTYRRGFASSFHGMEIPDIDGQHQ